MREVVISLLGVCIAVAEAEAGPWGRHDGEAYARLAGAGEIIDGAQAWRVDAYGEYGLKQDWTLIGKYETVRFPNAREFDASETRLLLQRRLFNERLLVGSAGGGLVYGAAIGGVIGCETIGFEARTSAGTKGILAGRNWYASVDLSGRWHTDGCRRQKLDLVFGFEQRKNVTFAPQIFIEKSNRGADSKAVQLEWIEHHKWFDLSYGYKYEAGDLFQQHATIVGISKRF